MTLKNGTQKEPMALKAISILGGKFVSMKKYWFSEKSKNSKWNEFDGFAGIPVTVHLKNWSS